MSHAWDSKIIGHKSQNLPTNMYHPKKSLRPAPSFFLMDARGVWQAGLDSRENLNLMIYMCSIFCCSCMDWPQWSVKSPHQGCGCACALWLTPTLCMDWNLFFGCAWPFPTLPASLPYLLVQRYVYLTKFNIHWLTQQLGINIPQRD